MKQQNNQIEWKKVELRELGDIGAGGTPSRAKPEYWGGDIPWLKISNLKDFYVSKYDETITEKGLKSSSAKIFKKGTILISIFASLGDVAILDIDATTNQAIAGIYNLNETIDRKYLALYLKSLKEYFEKTGRGVAQNNINLSILRSTKIALPFSNGKPNLKEQERIVKLLEKSEKQKEISKKTEVLLDEYIKAIFNEMFYNKGFEEVSLGDISKISMGGTPLTSKPEYWHPSEINWMKSGDIKGDIILEVPQKISKEGFNHSNTSIYPKGTVVIALNGQGKTRGTSAVLGIETCSNQSVSGIIPNKEKLASEYLHYNLKLRYNELRNITGNDSRSGLNLTILRNLKILLPSISLQQEFTKIVKQFEKMKENIKKTKHHSEELFNALMQKAFRGEL